MSLLQNKHVIAALVITPLLAIGGYFAADALLSETPHAAKAGASYQLVEKPNCRYSSGLCELKNNQFELKITGSWIAENTLQLNVNSKHALDGVKIAYGQNAEHLKPVAMSEVDKTGESWVITLPSHKNENDKLFLVASNNNTFYFGEASVAFIEYETSYAKDFRSN